MLNQSDLSFEVSPEYILIEQSGENGRLQFHHSFHRPDFFYQRATSANQALLKACSNKQKTIRSLLDLTGGWGIDAFILAQHGKQVTMLEQNQKLVEIVAASLQNAALHRHSAQAAANMQALCINAIDYLQQLANNKKVFQCIYLDPMFPMHKSSAKPAREMQILQSMTENTNIDQCFRLALKKTENRVVVKRPAKAKFLLDLKPDFSHREKSIRFDVYLASTNRENY